MKRETVLALRAVDRCFYVEHAEEFSGTRERPWKGWTELFDRIAPLLPEEPRVLDVGCGNGRFARFLESALERPFRYLGVDASAPALREARRRLGHLPQVDLVELDFVTTEVPLPRGDFDLIVVFGVLHHVPGSSNRRALLRELGGRLAEGGLLAFTVWRFDRHDRFRRKLVPFEATGLELDPEDLEEGDAFMTWGREPPALRYCHATSDAELDELVASLGLPVVARFDSENEPNSYVALGDAVTPLAGSSWDRSGRRGEREGRKQGGPRGRRGVRRRRRSLDP